MHVCACAHVCAHMCHSHYHTSQTYWWTEIVLETCFVRLSKAGFFTYMSALWFSWSIKQLGNERICTVITKINIFKCSKFNILSGIVCFWSFCQQRLFTLLCSCNKSVSRQRDESTATTNASFTPLVLSFSSHKHPKHLTRAAGLRANRYNLPSEAYSPSPKEFICLRDMRGK